MEYRNLGTSGLEVSRLGLGTIPFGSVLDDDECDRILTSFREVGGNFVDTANQYGGGVRGSNAESVGRAEAAIGRAFKGRRKEFVLATKGYWLMQDEVSGNSVGLSRTYLQREIEASLRRLNSDWIDLYQCHAFDKYTPVEETLRTLDDAVHAGKIRYVGVSNWDGWQVVKAVALSSASHLSPPISNQVWYNLLDRSIENSIVPACRDQGVGVIAWGVAANGLLTGRYGPETRGHNPGRFATEKDEESSSWKRLATDRSWAILDTMTSIAGVQGWHPVNVATRWALDAERCDVALVGGSSVRQYEQQFEISDAKLPASAMELLDSSSASPTPYPINLHELYCRRESAFYGGIR